MTRPSNAAPDPAHGARHICVPFETADESREAFVAFIHAGLDRGNRCLFVGSAAEYQALGQGLEELGICAQRAEARGALLFMTVEQAYLEDGVFAPEKVLARVDRFIQDALADGFAGLYATGELRHEPGDDVWRDVVWYEAHVNEHFAREPFAALCRYPRSIVPPHRVCDVLRTHPVAVVRGEACANPFYERPELALSDDSQARLDWQLRQLRVQNRTQRHLEEKTVSAVTAAVELATELEALRSTLPPSTRT
ncbi:MAG TPA: MEDS domain-containing protein [Polyangia bacterium]|nr:MEDS domain-containing protein [Polyangia bacterium]